MSANAQQASAPPSPDELFRPPIVLDAHEDVLLNLLNPKNNRSLAEPGANGQANFANWRAGGVNAVFFAVWVDPRQFRGPNAVQRAEQMIALYNQQIQLYPDKLVACDTSDEVRRAIASGKIAALLGVEGGIAINNDLANIARYRSQGVRYMTLTWRGNLDWAGSSQDLTSQFRRGQQIVIAENPSKGGLTEFGRRVVAEMNRVGMMVDLSHVSDQTFFDAIKASTKPVIVSHSNARALSDHARNVSDDMLRALKSNGGVIGVNLWYELLEPQGRGSKKEDAERVTVKNVLDQIDHMVKVAGIDHIGLGTDFEGMNDLPADMKTAASMGKIFSGMRQRGYSEAAIRKLAGENFLRVMKANE
jgi:membrane dipeptidase